MDVLELIDHLEDIIEGGTPIPITGKVMLNKADLLDMLKEIRIKLPDEMKQAQWITQEKQRIIAEAQRQADAMIKETDVRLKREIEHHDITSEANKRASDIINNAQRNAKEIRLGAKEYADQLLSELEKSLNTNGKELSEKLQSDTSDMLNRIQMDVIELIKMVNGLVDQKTMEVRDNIKELRRMNG